MTGKGKNYEDDRGDGDDGVEVQPLLDLHGFPVPT